MRFDARHEEYDETFHKMFIEEEQRRLWRIEDNTLTKAESDPPTARFVLSNLLKEKYGKLEGTGTTQNLYWFHHGWREQGHGCHGTQCLAKPR